MQLWLLAFGILALFGRLGVTFGIVGGCRAKNGVGQIGRTLSDVTVAVFAFWAIGAALLFARGVGNRFASASGPVITVDRALVCSQGGAVAPTAAFHLVAVLIAGGVVTAALAERGTAVAGAVGAVVLAGFVVPVAGYWTWYGWLANQHYIDVGGGTVLHVSAATVAAVAAATVGGRAGKYAVAAPTSIPGHALPLLGLGALMTAFGFVPLLLGATVAHATTDGAIDDWPSALGTAGMNALLAAAGGTAGGLAYAHLRFGKPDLFFAVAGLLGGMVAVSAGVIALGNVGAVGVGLGAGVLVPMAAVALDRRVKLDDPLGVISIHGVGGLWGTLAIPLLCPRRTGGTDLGPELADRARLLAVQLAGTTAVVALAAAAAGVAYGLLRFAVRFRLTTADEVDGIDQAEFGVVSYPEFVPGRRE